MNTYYVLTSISKAVTRQVNYWDFTQKVTTVQIPGSLLKGIEQTGARIVSVLTPEPCPTLAKNTTFTLRSLIHHTHPVAPDLHPSPLPTINQLERRAD